MFKNHSPFTLADNNFEHGILLEPLEADILQKVFQLIRERNWDAVDSLAADNKLGPVGFFFGKTVTGIFETAKLSTEANMVRTRTMQSFMKAITDTNDKVNENYQILRKMPQETKRELVLRIKRGIDTYLREFQEFIMANESQMSRAKYSDCKKTLDARHANTEPLSDNVEENKFMREIQEVIKIMMHELTLAIVEMSKNDTTLVGPNIPHPNIITQVSAAKPKKSGAPKEKTYEKYKARDDYQGNAEEKELSFNKGDILYVYKSKDLDGNRWFKAAKPKADNVDEPNPKDKGLVFSEYVKKL